MTTYLADNCGFCCTNNVLCKLGHYQGHQRSKGHHCGGYLKYGYPFKKSP